MKEGWGHVPGESGRGELEMDIEQDISLTFMKLSHNKQEIVCFKKERKKEN